MDGAAEAAGLGQERRSDPVGGARVLHAGHSAAAMCGKLAQEGRAPHAAGMRARSACVRVLLHLQSLCLFCAVTFRSGTLSVGAAMPPDRVLL